MKILKLLLGLLATLAVGYGACMLVVWLVPIRGTPLAFIVALAGCAISSVGVLASFFWAGLFDKVI